MNHMKHCLAALVFGLAAPAFAGPLTDSLVTCLADSTTGRDRKELARWMFVALAAHPEIRDLSNVSPAAGETSSRNMGKLITRLLSEDCSQQTRAAMRSEGQQALGAAFEGLGKLAVQELLGSAEVRAAVGGFEKFMDRPKVESALRQP